MKELILILSLFRSEAKVENIVFPDSVTIEFAELGRDTLGVASKDSGQWVVKISKSVEPDILETVVYHELGHVAGLDHCKGRSIMNYGYLLPMTPGLKRSFFKEIRLHQLKCK